MRVKRKILTRPAANLFLSIFRRYSLFFFGFFYFFWFLFFVLCLLFFEIKNVYSDTHLIKRTAEWQKKFHPADFRNQHFTFGPRITLTLNRFRSSLWYFYCWIWTSKCLLGFKSYFKSLCIMHFNAAPSFTKYFFLFTSDILDKTQNVKCPLVSWQELWFLHEMIFLFILIGADDICIGMLLPDFN